ncbi:MAG: RDD family protein [Planctomycetota bacterium]
MSDANPYAPPTSPAGMDPFSEPNSPVLAGRFTRFAAAVVDGLIVMVVVLPVQFLTGFQQRLQTGDVGLLEQILMMLVGMGAYLIPHGYTLFTRGQSLGKLLTRIRIVDYNTGELLPPLRVYVARYLWVMPFSIVVMLIPGIADDFLVNLIVLADSLFIFGGERRCIHDYIAGSKVIQLS